MHYSIIMPVYNGRDYFEEALLSAIGAAGQYDEIIVVEDGSTDGGVEDIVKRHKSEIDIKYLSKENGGVATALNLGIENATREIFTWLSHDDIYLPNRLEADRALRAHSPDVVTVSDFYLLNNDTGFLSYINSIVNLTSRQRFRLLSRRFLNGNCLSAPIASLKYYGGFEKELLHTQDYDLWLRLLQRQDFVAIPVPTVLSRQHGNQDTRTQPAISKREYKVLLKNYLSISDFFDPRNTLDLIRILKSLLF
ncbi:Glycosyl transferase family 2 [Amphritea atlantica]|uniref:Glycosyl transferase family 2 n=1 Tax=Amphritea atlantica TaxID=355243 RepID=A0A1H9L6R4_9GAMM|nr:glycosyltransferase [Amphritea atlantica]SER06837.1 Glycosyl transferase family 2 [Amphritea atlantica]